MLANPGRRSDMVHPPDDVPKKRPAWQRFLGGPKPDVLEFGFLDEFQPDGWPLPSGPGSGIARYEARFNENEVKEITPKNVCIKCLVLPPKYRGGRICGVCLNDMHRTVRLAEAQEGLWT